MHLYIVDKTLQILLAQRDIELSDKCQAVIKKHVAAQKRKPFSDEGFRKKVQRIWTQKSPAMMRKEAAAVQHVALSIPHAPHVPQDPKKLH